MLTSVLIVNLAVLAAVLLADLGRKEITRRRIVRPVIVTSIVVALFVKAPQLSGNGLLLEAAALAGGLALGTIGARLLMSVTKDQSSGRPMSVAGASYAAFWTLVVGARLLFTYGASHWYNTALGHWLSTNSITVDGLTDALILLSIGLVLARVIRFTEVLAATGSSSRGRQLRSALTHA